MFRPRIIPVLLLKGPGLIKTTEFKNPRYIGDPINAVKIFNDLRADELIFLDIYAGKEGRSISPELVMKLGDEAYMPFAVGGGLKSLSQIHEVLKAGAEKVVLNSATYNDISLIREAASDFGSQSIVASIDVKKGLLGGYTIYSDGGSKKRRVRLEDHIMSMIEAGIGEIMINSIDNDGKMMGYDLNLVKLVAEISSVPVIACGGAGSMTHLLEVYKKSKVSALAAGSMFVYHGARKAVLINYPDKDQMENFIKELNANI